MLVDHYSCTTDAANSWKGLISLNPPPLSSFIKNNLYCLILIVGISLFFFPTRLLNVDIGYASKMPHLHQVCKNTRSAVCICEVRAKKVQEDFARYKNVIAMRTVAWHIPFMTPKQSMFSLRSSLGNK